MLVNEPTEERTDSSRGASSGIGMRERSLAAAERFPIPLRWDGRSSVGASTEPPRSALRAAAESSSHRRRAQDEAAAALESPTSAAAQPRLRSGATKLEEMKHALLGGRDPTDTRSAAQRFFRAGSRIPGESELARMAADFGAPARTPAAAAVGAGGGGEESPDEGARRARRKALARSPCPFSASRSACAKLAK